MFFNSFWYYPQSPAVCASVFCTDFEFFSTYGRSQQKIQNLAVQNIWTAAGFGAYTGELTADMVKDFGLQWVITGHSERRHKVAAESSDMVAQKTKAAQMLEFFTNDLIAQGLSQEDAFNRALEAVNRLIKAA